jgi:hypothetical protein
VDTNMLERMDLPTNGPLFKSESGELSNLRWDLPEQQMPYYYSRPNRKQFTWEFGLLANFTKGLAGGGPGSRWGASCSDATVLVDAIVLC